MAKKAKRNAKSAKAKVKVAVKSAAAKKGAAKRVPWTKALHAELRKHSKAKTPVAKIAKQMKRTVGALRQQAIKLGIPLGHRR